MQLPPPSVVASWPPGDFDHPSQIRGPEVIILIAFFIPIMITAVAARTYSRIHIVKDFGSDDGFILAALLPALILAFVAIFSTTTLGWRQHAWDMASRPDLVVLGMKLVMATEILFSLCASLTKISMLLFTRKIIGQTMPRLRIATNVILAVVFIENIIFITVVVLTCRPISDFWNLSIKPQDCVDETAHLLAAGIINTLTDFLVVMLPIPVALNLSISRQQKRILLFLFGSGFLVCFAGVVRTYYTYIFTKSFDKTWLGFPVWLTQLIELYLALITASLPGLKPLVSRYAPSILGSLPKRKASKPDIYNMDDLYKDPRNSFAQRFQDKDIKKRYSIKSTELPPYNINSNKERPSTPNHELPATTSLGDMPRRPNQTVLKPPQRPALAQKRPSFYTAMYGSTETDDNQRRTQSPVNKKMPISTGNPRNQPMDPDDDDISEVWKISRHNPNTTTGRAYSSPTAPYGHNPNIRSTSYYADRRNTLFPTWAWNWGESSLTGRYTGDIRVFG